jgi:thiol:disulfide interchange protein DsbA
MTRYISIAAALLLLTIPFAASQAVTPAKYQEHEAYERIVPAQPTADPAKVEVVEVFWYGCPHCFRFQPFIERWLLTKPAYVNYVRLPAILNESWAIHARAYYTAEALGVVEKIHEPLFDAIHIKKQRLDTEAALADFFAQYGVDKNQFKTTFNSFAVSTKVARARELTRRYGIDGTPSIIVNGKYRTGPGMSGGNENLMDVVDFLVAQEEAEMKTKKATP